MKDSDLYRVVQSYLDGQELAADELDAVLELHESLIYQLNMFGGVYEDAIRQLQSDKQVLAHLIGTEEPVGLALVAG